GLNAKAEGESATWTQSERNNSVKDSERTDSSNYASESRGALDLNVDADAENETTLVVETNR
uniref:hypothetical protein n=2 Tax=Paenibacillus TaxID=44249 RepID=UPI0028F0CD66